MAGPRLLDVDYVERTRSLPVNLLFLMPWVLVYQLALMGTGSRLDNAAAAWLRAGIGALGSQGFVLLSLVACLLLCLVVLLRLREASEDHGVFGGMLLEGLVYGALLGVVAQVLAQRLPMVRVVPLSAGPALAPGASSSALGSLSVGAIASLRATLEDIGLALGAGIFEELVFRGLLVGGLVLLVGRGLGAGRWLTAALAIPVAAYIFSDYHHWGVGGEPYVAEVFAYRFHAGIVLGAIYATRGLGIAALAHGFYDVLVLAQR